jgi:ABC-type branched-subunit amino acid transport system substrate-binding protein
LKKAYTIAVAFASLAIGSALMTSPAGAATDTSTAPIVVGGQGDLSLAAGIGAGFQARISAFNRQGGLGGRKIKFVGMLDDGFSPSTNLSNAQKLVQNDHVFADVPFNSEVCTGATGTFLEQNKTPYLGYAVCGAFGPTYPWGFGYNGYQTSPTAGTDTVYLNMEKILHKKASQVKLAISGLSLASQAVTEQTEVAKKIGLDVVYSEANIPLTATDYSPYAQGIIASGANAVFGDTDSSHSIALAAALKAAGYKGIFLNGATYEPDQLASLPSVQSALQGVYTTNQFPVDENNTPATRQAEKDLKAIGQPTLLTNGVAIGYWTGDVFVQALKATAAKVGAANVTPESFQKVASKGFTYTASLPGGVASETFPNAFSNPTPCGSVLVPKGSTYKVVIPYSCGHVIKLG